MVVVDPIWRDGDGDARGCARSDIDRVEADAKASDTGQARAGRGHGVLFCWGNGGDHGRGDNGDDRDSGMV